MARNTCLEETTSLVRIQVDGSENRVIENPNPFDAFIKSMDKEMIKDLSDCGFNVTNEDFKYVETLSVDECLIVRVTSLLKEKKEQNHFAIFSFFCYFIQIRINIYKSRKSKEDKDTEMNKKVLSLNNYRTFEAINSLVKDVNEDYQLIMKLIIFHYARSRKEQLDSDIEEDIVVSDSEIGKSDEIIYNHSMKQLLNFLEKGLISHFEEKLNNLLATGFKIYGSYFEFLFKPFAKFFFQIAEVQEKQSFQELIFRSCPYVGINSSLIDEFNQLMKIESFYLNEESNLKPCLERFAEDLLRLTIVRQLENKNLLKESLNDEVIDSQQ